MAGFGHYQKILDELPIESAKGLREGAVGRTTVIELIDAGWWNSANEDVPVGKNNQWKIDVAKAIRGKLKNITESGEAGLQLVIEKYIKGEAGLQQLYRDYGVNPATFGEAPNATDIQTKSANIKAKMMEYSAAKDVTEAAAMSILDILAFNLISSGEYADLVNISADEAGTNLNESWYSASSVGFLGAAQGGLSAIYNDFIADEEQAEIFKQTLALRRDSILAGKSEKEIAARTEEQNISSIKFHLQTLLAANMSKLATKSEADRSYSAKKYKKTWMMHAHPSEIVNKLTYVAGSEEFADITVAEASSLIPMIRLYKIIYNSEGEREKVLPIVFNSYTKTEDIETSGLEGLGRSGVGIKSFDWQYNGTNIATTKNDITAKLVLYFQNFNDLLKVQPHGFRYIDLLIRTKPGEGKNSDNSIEDPCVPGSSSPETDIADPRHFEIKAVAGWAPNLDYAKSVGKDNLAVGIQGQVVPLFLSLIEHEFSIQQDGTFELTIEYRGRIDGIMMDKRADIILTPQVRHTLCTLEVKLKAAQEGCFTESIDKIKHEIKLTKERARNTSGMHITMGLLEKNKVYCLELSKDQWAAAGGKVYNIDSSDLTGIENLKLLSSVQLDDDRDALEEQKAQVQSEQDAQDLGVNVGGCSDTWAEYIAGGLGANAGTINGMWDGFFGGTTAQESEDWMQETILGSSGTDATGELSDWQNCYLRQEQGGYQFWSGNAVTNPGDPIRDVSVHKDPSGGIGSAFGLTAEDDGRLIIPYFFFGDLVDLAANIALGEGKYAPPGDDCGGNLNPNRVENLGIILGTMHLDKFGTNEEKTINLGDIPIALPYFRDWWFRNVNKANTNTFPLIRFIRECLKDFVVDAVGGEVLGGRRPQRLLMKDASISIPAMAPGISPIRDKIDKNRFKPAGASGTFDPGKLIASRLLGDAITNTAPLTPINPPNLTPDEMFHYKVFYLVNESPTYLNGDKFEDNKRGIQHIVMGARTGILKDAQFKRSTVKGLREQRVIEESELNPLKHLADVYNITAKMIGNVIFYPGQLVYLNPIGFGSKLGLPTNPMSPSRAMGLGGYHLITQVSSYIENGKFETTVEALFETSGGKDAKRADNGRETESTKCDTSLIETPSEDVKNNIDKPEGGETT